MSLEPNSFQFLELIMIFEIYLGMKSLFQNCLYIWRHKGVKGVNKFFFKKLFFQLKFF